MFNYFGKYFKITILLIIFFELLSFGVFNHTLLNNIIFFIILLITLILSLKKLEYGFLILLAELFIGSKGYLFFFEYQGILVSIRMGLFLIILSVWLAKLIRDRKFTLYNSKFFWYYLVLFIFIGWGIVNGFIQNNFFENIFFDFNAFLYFALVPVFFDVIKSEKQINRILQVLMAALTAIAIKTFILTFFFSHYLFVYFPIVYTWVRDTGVGEITMVTSGFYRIFFQTQIYSLIGLFIILGILIWQKRFDYQDKVQRNLMTVAILCATTILISFSRSFWLGLIMGFLILYFVMLFVSKFNFKKILKVTSSLIILIVVALGLTMTMVNFPYPRVGDWIDASLISQRLTSLTGEAAVSSRWSLLEPLGLALTKHPITGSGFGTTVTYKSEDPRILAQNLDGWYTTYAFEWGYLDTMLKIGLAGLLVYLFLIWKIWQRGWEIFKENKNALAIGILLGLVSLLATNIASPYLNHPLGIGYIMLCGAIFYIIKRPLYNMGFDD